MNMGAHLTAIFFAASTVVITNSLFFGMYLFSLRKKSVSNLYLAFLLFALAIRIGKSVLALSFSDTPDVIPSLGLVGMATIGPFLFLYIESLTGAVWNKPKIAHFVPAISLAFLIPLATEDTILHFYQLVVIQIFAYLILSIYTFSKRPVSGNKTKWVSGLLAGVGLIWVAFFVQLVWEYYTSYLFATTTAAMVLFVLSFWAMRKQKMFNHTGTKPARSDALAKLSVEVTKLFESNKIHLDFDITIRKVAKMLRVQPYLVSQAINNQFQMTFPELVTTYRVNEVKQKLGDPTYHHQSIESIAYESGFVTPSAFYATFKKVTGQTPGQFRKGIHL